MLLGAGLDSAIADPCDETLKEWVRIVEQRDEGSALARLIVALHDAVGGDGGARRPKIDMGDPEQVALYKTYRMLTNSVIYADSYLSV